MTKGKHRQRIRIVVGRPDLSPEQLEKMRKEIRKDAKKDAKKIRARIKKTAPEMARRVSQEIAERQAREKEGIALFYARGLHRQPMTV